MKILIIIFALMSTNFSASAKIPEAFARLSKIQVISSSQLDVSFKASGDIRLFLLSNKSKVKWKRNGKPADFISMIAKDCTFKIRKRGHLSGSIRDPKFSKEVDGFKNAVAILKKSNQVDISIHSVIVTIKDGLITEIIGTGIQIGSPLAMDLKKAHPKGWSKRKRDG